MKLITIGFSHYCEKARWGLDRSGVEYTEESHAPLAHILAVFRVGGKRTVPVLATDDGVFSDSTDILKYVDPFIPEESRLYPREATARREVEDLEDFFDEKLGPRARRWAYSWLVDEPALLHSLFDGASTPAEKKLAPLMFPPFRWAARKSFKLSPAVRVSEFEKIRRVFVQAEEKCSGEKYLIGDRFSAADLTLASLAVPALFPEENPWPMPQLSDLPSAMRDQVEELRATKLGMHALCMYRDERNRRFKPLMS